MKVGGKGVQGVVSMILCFKVDKYSKLKVYMGTLFNVYCNYFINCEYK